MNPFHVAWPSSQYCVDSEVTGRHQSSPPILVDGVIKAHLGSPKVTWWGGKYGFGSLWKIYSPMCSFIIIQIYDALLSCLPLFLFHIFPTLTKILLFSFLPSIHLEGQIHLYLLIFTFLLSLVIIGCMFQLSLEIRYQLFIPIKTYSFFPTKCNINLPQIPWLSPILIR